jgi:hypothetical protein
MRGFKMRSLRICFEVQLLRARISFFAFLHGIRVAEFIAKNL